MNTRVVGVSVDHVPALVAWAESLGGISFPLLSDFWPHGEMAQQWGVFRESDGHSERAVFVVDAEGIIRYMDVHDITDQPDNEVLFSELEKLQPSTAARSAANAEPAAQPTPEQGTEEPVALSGLVMYCRSWCPDCRRARAWLDERGVAYVEVDVDRDPEARDRAAALNEGRLHTPTFVIGGDVCVDFRPERLTELIDMM